MIVIFGSGIIGLFIAKKLLENKKKVLIFDTLDVSANATSASVGMLAPLIETKPYENQLLSLMIDSKKLWDKDFKENKLANLVGLKKNFSLLIAKDLDELDEIKFKKHNKLNMFCAFRQNRAKFALLGTCHTGKDATYSHPVA